MALDMSLVQSIVARLSVNIMDEMIETYDDMDYEDFDTFCYHYDLPFADSDDEDEDDDEDKDDDWGFQQLHAFMLHIKALRA